MFRLVVAAVDGSEGSLKALDRAILLAAGFRAALDIVSVEEDLPHYVSKQAEIGAERSAAERYFGTLHAEAVVKATEAGVPTTTRILAGHEVQTLLNYVQDRRADLLVLGARGHSVGWDAFLGSTADKIVAHVPSSVLVVRPSEAGRTFREVVVGLDGSPLGTRALTAALELCHVSHGIIRAISVLEGPPGASPAVMQAWTTYLDRVAQTAREIANADGVQLDVATRRGHAAEMITVYADEVDADLIVVGATGHERPWSLTSGGTARRIANEAHCSILIVRPSLVAQKVADVMTHQVNAVRSETPLQTVVDQLIRRGVKALPVVDGERRVIGIVTGGDLLRRGGLGLRLSLHGQLEPRELITQLSRLADAGQTAQNVMTPDPLTITADTTLDAAIQFLVRHRIKRLPVVDDDHRLVGIISRTDLLRSIAESPPVTSTVTTSADRARTVEDLLVTDIPVVAPDTPGEAVLTAVLGSPFRRAVVVDEDRRVLGIVTDQALLAHADPVSRPGLFARLADLMRSSPGATPQPLTAATLMEREVFTISSKSLLAEATRSFIAHRVKRLVVVDEGERLVGILDRRALFQSLVSALETGAGSDTASSDNTMPPRVS